MRSTRGCTPSGWTARHVGSDDTRRRSRPCPDGAFVVDGDSAFLVLGEALLRWTPGGYVDQRPRPSGTAAVLTPPSLVAVLAGGWEGAVPLLHPLGRKPGGRLKTWRLVGQEPT